MAQRLLVCVFLSLVLVSLHVEGKLQYLRSKSGWTHRSNPYKHQLEAMYSKEPLHVTVKLEELKKEGLGIAGGRYRRADNEPLASRPAVFDGDFNHYASVHYSGDDSDVVFVLTYSRGANGHVSSSNLYRSIDYGTTFVNESNKFPAGFKLHSNFRVNPTDKNVLIFPDDIQKVIYVTTDEGEHYSRQNVPIDPTQIVFHPVVVGWMMGRNPDDDTLMVSTNLGADWKTVSNYVGPYNRFYWGVPGIDWPTTAYTTAEVGIIFFGTYDPSDFSRTTHTKLYVSVSPFDATSKQEIDENLDEYDDFVLDEEYIFVQHTVDSENSETELLVSYQRKPFKVARIPFEEAHHNYFVSSHRSAQAVVVVEHESNVNNMYISDNTGAYYTLSLDNLVASTSEGYIDLEWVESMNGTFIANQYIFDQQNKKTLISFDNGARWRVLEAPQVDVNGNEIDCDIPVCSLHFQMSSTTDYRRLVVYSRESAPGLVLAHGNYGDLVDDDSAQIDLYISRDGGLRWEQTLSSSWDVAIIDHGGLLVAAKDYHQERDNTIMYSCDEGLNWREFQFYTDSMFIWGVVTEPGETTTEVTLFGSQPQTSRGWAVVSIDFSHIFVRTCTANDYVNWTISDGRVEDQDCLLGETRVVERRNPLICCLNGEQYERIVLSRPCECGFEDFECDWGYKNDAFDDNKCIVDSRFAGESNSGCSSGYRKIAGDSCIHGVEDLYMQCTINPANPGASSGSDSDSSKSALTAVLVVITIILSICVFVIIGLAVVVLLLMRKINNIRVLNRQEPVEAVHFANTSEDEDDALLRP